MWLLLTQRHIQVKSHVWQFIGHVILLTLSTHVLPDVSHPAHYLTLSAITNNHNNDPWTTTELTR